MKELNKAVQDLNVEIEKNKENTSGGKPGNEKLGKRSGITDTSMNNRIQEIEERISGIEDTVREIVTTVKENSKVRKLLTQCFQEIQDTMKRPNLRIIRIEKNGDSQLKEPENIFNKIILLKPERYKKPVEHRINETIKENPLIT